MTIQMLQSHLSELTVLDMSWTCRRHVQDVLVISWWRLRVVLDVDFDEQIESQVRFALTSKRQTDFRFDLTI